MPDLPGGQPPRIAGPIQGVAPVAASGGGARREPGQEQRQRPADGQPGAAKAPTPVDAGPPAVPDPLVQALDRLRATNELRPVDAELARLLRGKREYVANTPPGGQAILPPSDPGPPG